ncbi:MAG: hypothetical protein IJE43_20720 [Alphaproteobacteria bacterium]|nr:hypothetical protein [Alphaproteobacteria bacterium]
MGIFNLLLKGVSEEKLRKTERKMRNKLDAMGYESKRHTRLDRRRIDIVNAIASKSAGKLPKREHGWYLPNDD